jgi:hypothetical protein
MGFHRVAPHLSILLLVLASQKVILGTNSSYRQLVKYYDISLTSYIL